MCVYVHNKEVLGSKDLATLVFFYCPYINQINIWTFHQQKSTGKTAEINLMQCHIVGTSTLTGAHVKI